MFFPSLTWAGFIIFFMGVFSLLKSKSFLALLLSLEAMTLGSLLMLVSQSVLVSTKFLTFLLVVVCGGALGLTMFISLCRSGEGDLLF